MSKETGGFAFPSKVSNLSNEKQNIYGYDVPPGDSFIAGGMTLLDHFAGLAMQGDWAAQNEHQGGFANDVSEEILYARAKVYYRMAGAMLLARGE